MAEQKQNLEKSLAELATLVEWFEKQEEIDVEEGLKKVKLGAELIKASKKRLSEVENEFKEIQKEIVDEIGEEGNEIEK